MEKEKKIINVLTVFFISHKNDVKTFLKQILTKWPQDTRQQNPYKYHSTFAKKKNHGTVKGIQLEPFGMLFRTKIRKPNSKI